MRYAVDGYAVLGYFLQNETQVESAAIGVSTGSATAYATLNLQGDSLAASTSIGNVYSKIDLGGQAESILLSTGTIYSTQILFSDVYNTVSVVGKINLPSLYTGKLSLISLTSFDTIESLTDIKNIKSLTPILTIQDL